MSAQGNKADPKTTNDQKSSSSNSSTTTMKAEIIPEEDVTFEASCPSSSKLLQDLAPSGAIYQAHSRALCLLQQGCYHKASVALDALLKHVDMDCCPPSEEEEWLVLRSDVALELVDLPSTKNLPQKATALPCFPRASSLSSSSSSSPWALFQKAFTWSNIHPDTMLVIMEEDEMIYEEEEENDSHFMSLADLHEIVVCILFYNLGLSIHLAALQGVDEETAEEESDENQNKTTSSSCSRRNQGEQQDDEEKCPQPFVSAQETLMNQALGTYGMPLTEYSTCLEDHRCWSPSCTRPAAVEDYACSSSSSSLPPLRKKRKVAIHSFHDLRDSARSSRTGVVSTCLLEMALWNNCAHIHAYFWSRMEMHQCIGHLREGHKRLSRSERLAAHACTMNIFHANLNGPSSAA